VRSDFKKGAGMSNAQFAEAESADPFVKELHRRAVRVLNDSSLDREQRIGLIRQLQQRLLAHQTDEFKKAQRVAAKKAAKGQRLYGPDGELMAVPSQVVARRRELGSRQPVQEEVVVEPKRLQVVAAKVGHFAPRRPVLTLQRV
jgi:hypothetical protein